MPPGQPQPDHIYPLIDTRRLRSSLGPLLRGNTPAIILDRKHPRGFLIPCPLPKRPRTPDLRKARTRTLRRIRRIFDQLLRNHAH